jgi:hypothetical protein
MRVGAREVTEQRAVRRRVRDEQQRQVRDDGLGSPGVISVANG